MQEAGQEAGQEAAQQARPAALASCVGAGRQADGVLGGTGSGRTAILVFVLQAIGPGMMKGTDRALGRSRAVTTAGSKGAPVRRRTCPVGAGRRAVCWEVQGALHEHEAVQRYMKRYMNRKRYSTCLVGVGGREDVGAVVLVQRLGRAPVEDALAPRGAIGLGQAADLDQALLVRVLGQAGVAPEEALAVLH